MATRAATGPGPTGAALIILALFATVFMAMAGTEAWRDAPTYDEPLYIASGLAAVLDHNASVNPEHPPLTKLVAALPVLFVDPTRPDISLAGDEDRFGASFAAAEAARQQLRPVVFAARLVPILEAAAVGFVLFGLGRRLYSVRVGLLAGSLWLATPLVLGIGHLDSIDISMALMASLWALAVVSWLRRPRLLSASAVGLGCAAASLADIDGLVLIPLAVLVLACFGDLSGRERVRMIACLLVCCWVAIWASYLVIEPSLLLAPGLLPQPYLKGIAYLVNDNGNASAAYLLGQRWTGMRWWYLPAEFLVKNPPATALLLLVSPLAVLSRFGGSRRALAVLVLPALVLAIGPELSSREIGVRYLLPSMALASVAAASVVFSVRRETFSWAAAGLILLPSIGSTLASFPTSLSAVDPAFGPAYRVVSNSDVDWGQSLYALESWARGKQPWVAYFGPRGLGVGDVPGARPLLGEPLSDVTGWVAVSASELTLDPRLEWLWPYCPLQDIDQSVLVYRFGSAPSADTAPSRRPSNPCPAGLSYSEAAGVRS